MTSPISSVHPSITSQRWVFDLCCIHLPSESEIGRARRCRGGGGGAGVAATRRGRLTVPAGRPGGRAAGAHRQEGGQPSDTAGRRRRRLSPRPSSAVRAPRSLLSSPAAVCSPAIAMLLPAAAPALAKQCRCESCCKCDNKCAVLQQEGSGQ